MARHVSAGGSAHERGWHAPPGAQHDDDVPAAWQRRGGAAAAAGGGQRYGMQRSHARVRCSSHSRACWREARGRREAHAHLDARACPPFVRAESPPLTSRAVCEASEAIAGSWRAAHAAASADCRRGTPEAVRVAVERAPASRNARSEASLASTSAATRGSIPASTAPGAAAGNVDGA